MAHCHFRMTEEAKHMDVDKMTRIDCNKAKLEGREESGIEVVPSRLGSILSAKHRVNKKERLRFSKTD